MEFYILSYMDTELVTSHTAFKSKLKAINAFHSRVEYENNYLSDEEVDAVFRVESIPEDDIYIAIADGEDFSGKIEIIKINQFF